MKKQSDAEKNHVAIIEHEKKMATIDEYLRTHTINEIRKQKGLEPLEKQNSCNGGADR